MKNKLLEVPVSLVISMPKSMLSLGVFNDWKDLFKQVKNKNLNKIP